MRPQAQTPELGPLIRRSRLDASISIETMAAKVGLFPDQLATIEAGIVIIPYMILLRSAAVLDVLPGHWFEQLEGGSNRHQEAAQSADDDLEALRAVIGDPDRKQA